MFEWISIQKLFRFISKDLKDLISATRILQEKSSKTKPNKDNSMQTDDERPPQPPTPIRSSSSSRTTTSRSSSSIDILAPGTLVLALWKDDDGLFYEVCTMFTRTDNI